MANTDKDGVECINISSSDDEKDDVQEVKRILHADTELTKKEPTICNDDDTYVAVDDEDGDATIFLKVPTHHIVKVLVFNNRKSTVILFYLSAAMARFIRGKLDMNDPNGRYFNPVDGEESQKRFILVSKPVPENVRRAINSLYKMGETLDFLSPKEAIHILLLSDPIARAIQEENAAEKSRRIMIFPPPPSKGGITIGLVDYACLKKRSFINDVIIDFYLRYLFERRFSPQDKEKTHIFSSLFYNGLTNNSIRPSSNDVEKFGNVDNDLLKAYIRHWRVKNWTKNINIFEKDYIVIPLNKYKHWFLAIICFPNLSGPLRMVDNKPVDDKKQSNSTENAPLKMKIEESFIGMEEYRDKNVDEADGEGEEVYLESVESPVNETGTNQSTPVGNNKFRVPIKQPCILIFDSWAGGNRYYDIIATLREYLKIEYLAKYGVQRDFSKKVMKVTCPKVPQQNNLFDCGLFVLQYVEEFFTNKILDYYIPMKTLQDWFDPTTVGRKRYKLQQLLLELLKEQHTNPDSLNLSSGEQMHANHFPESPVGSPLEGFDIHDFYSSLTSLQELLKQCNVNDEPYKPRASEGGSEFDIESYAGRELEARQSSEYQDYNVDNEPCETETNMQKHDQNESSSDEREDNKGMPLNRQVKRRRKKYKE